MDTVAQVKGADLCLPGQQIQDLRPERAGVDVEKRKRYRQMKAAWPSTAWVEQEYPIAGLDRGFVGVAADHHGDLSGPWIDLEIFEGMNQIEEVSVEFNGVGRGQRCAGTTSVDVAANSSKGSEGAKVLQYSGVAYVAGVQDVVRSSQGSYCLGTKQAVSIGEDADQHGMRVNLDLLCFMPAQVRAGYVGQAGREGHPR